MTGCQVTVYPHLLESNPLLVHLSLEDTNLSDCLPQILHLLRSCRLKGEKTRSCVSIQGLHPPKEASS